MRDGEKLKHTGLGQDRQISKQIDRKLHKQTHNVAISPLESQ